jgi:hypothetical protein
LDADLDIGDLPSLEPESAAPEAEDDGIIAGGTPTGDTLSGDSSAGGSNGSIGKAHDNGEEG